MISYYVLRAAPKREFQAADEITRRGYQALVPVEVKWQKSVRRRGRTRGRKYPLFIRYVFVGCVNVGAMWNELRGDPDVHPKLIQGRGPLGFGGIPFRLAPSDVAYLMSLSSRTIPYTKAPNPHRAAVPIKEGARAQIAEGAMVGHAGRVSRVIGKNATVLIELFGSMQEVQIAVAKLEVIG